MKITLKPENDITIWLQTYYNIECETYMPDQIEATYKECFISMDIIGDTVYTSYYKHGMEEYKTLTRKTIGLYPECECEPEEIDNNECQCYIIGMAAIYADLMTEAVELFDIKTKGGVECF